MILKKLLIVKATVGAIAKQSTNPFYRKKYADINNLLEQLSPALEEQNLLLIQPVEVIGEPGAFTQIIHTQLIDLESETFEKVESRMILPEYDDPQAVGSVLSYYRRYSLFALLGLPTTDDDANHASGKVVPEKTESGARSEKAKIWLSKDQFEIAMKATAKQIENVLKAYDGTNGKQIRKDYRTKLEKQLESLLKS